MPVVAVVGGQWGDEGKGKIVDLLAGQADVVIRAQGGDNAGHTVVNPLGGSPCTWSRPASSIPARPLHHRHRRCAQPAILLEELDALRAARRRHRRAASISDRAHMVMPYHLLLDQRGGEAARQRGHRHDRARHRPRLRRQGRAHRPAHGRPARHRSAPSTPAPDGRPQERRAHECWATATK